MATLNTSYHSQYKQALLDPTRLSEEELLGLLLKYPYSQPLIFAYERRKKLINQESQNKELALLYAQSESWLLSYVNKPIESDINLKSSPLILPTVDQIQIDKDEQLIPEESMSSVEMADSAIEEVAGSLGDLEELNAAQVDQLEGLGEAVHDSVNYETVELGNLNEQIEEDDIKNELPEDVLDCTEPVEDTASEEQRSEDALELDRLVQVGGITGNYFVFDSYENKENEISDELSELASESEELVTSAIEKVDDKDDVSLYNDELMPYSFRWWLYKTRLEHADTYQPYVTLSVALAESTPTINVAKIEETILDQQIKENIIHFQDPEEKLSEEVKKKPLVPVVPKKGAEIIEKFIQKDPIIKPPSPENINNENMARQSAEDNYYLVTETLANIYIDQGLHLKAIEVFKKLILKYPEKKSYFANRIEELEKNS
ncbi:hypothetical protein [Sphingobacterium bovisgrunnientis]|uniref:hypothetical protein n=1 Tax=Sphingobacterium bovisgrunnientis TaxID=1874697 RepID=UPI001358C31B|nr:hypothetical protein [Sphingobacterium bovisgrunnientis]